MKAAHIKEGTQEVQTVAEHSIASAELASGYSIKPLRNFIYNIGLLHDIGKYQQSFQDKIYGKTNKRVEHAVCGALQFKELINSSFYLMAQYCIVGHHTGLPDGGMRGDNPDDATLTGRLGLDSYIGYCHALRSGRSSLACDLMEETRCLADRFVLTLINLRIITEKDFDKQVSGAVWLNEEGRKKVLTHWQEKKRTDYVHPYLKQKIQFGLIPYIQSNLLAKYIRGELPEYPCFLLK